MTKLLRKTLVNSIMTEYNKLNHDRIQKGNNHMEVKLSDEQQALFEIMEGSRQHLFVTGRAGAGKSVLLRHFRENTKKRVVVAAPTGIAALNVRGQTIHSLFKLPPRLYRKGSLSPNTRLYSMLKRIDCIIIDEISMVRADIMDAIDERLRKAHNKDMPFGGVQVIMFGDVYQLPPVVEENLAPYFEAVHGGHFFFNALAWQEAKFKIYELTQVFRQKDPVFKDILNAVREGSVLESQIEQLNARHGDTVPAEGVITLAPTNSLVSNINQQKLDQLPGKARQYQAAITGEMKRSVFPTEEYLQLKKGAQVVLLKNDLDKRWVNGTVGKIAKLEADSIEVEVGGSVYTLDKESWEEINYTYDATMKKVEAEVTSSFTQYPIRLAWALTIHKSQGQTYEQVNLDLTTATFAAGQMYVALSRCTSLEGLYLKMPVKQSHIIVDAKVSAFMLKRETIKIEPMITIPDIRHDEINIGGEELNNDIHHDEINADRGELNVAILDIRHDGIDTTSIAQNGKIEPIQNQDEIEGELLEVSTGVLREKKGRTKKERKSTRGRKAKSGVVREPLQLSLDVSTIKRLSAMGVNKSQLFETLLQQYEPFKENRAEVSTESAAGLDAEELRAKVQAQQIEDLEQETNRLRAQLDIEKRYHADHERRSFKAWLKKQPGHAIGDLGQRILTDELLPPMASRAGYEARLRSRSYSPDDQQEFAHLWKLMLLQS